MSVPLPALGVQKGKVVPCTRVLDTPTATLDGGPESRPALALFYRGGPRVKRKLLQLHRNEFRQIPSDFLIPWAHAGDKMLQKHKARDWRG